MTLAAYCDYSDTNQIETGLKLLRQISESGSMLFANCMTSESDIIIATMTVML